MSRSSKIYISLTALFIVSIAYALNYVAINNWYIDRIEFTGATNFFDEAELEPVLNSYIGHGILKANLKQLQRDLKHHPWVHEVNITRQWPNTLKLKVIEEEPLAILRQSLVVTTSGSTFRVESGPSKDLLKFDFDLDKLKLGLNKYFAIKKQLLGTNIEIDTLGFTKKHGWYFIANDGFKVIVGHENTGDRIRRFVLAYARKLESMVGDFEYIDLRYTNGVAVGWKTANN